MLRNSLRRVTVLIFVLFSILSLPVVAQSGTITMVAVSESDDGNFSGAIADLTLDVREGTGRVFIETLPLSKVDTQISTRFAKDIACSFIDADCSKYDFFYTISAPATIVGGPSGGAAISVLTVAVLDGLTLDTSKTITGTISSGPLIGPVGSIESKIDAANDAGFSTILVPEGQRPETNGTKNGTTLGENLTITITEVVTLRDAVHEFTGTLYEQPEGDIVISDTYEQVMRSLAIGLCNRSNELASAINTFELANTSIITPSFVNAQRNAINMTVEAAHLFDEEQYYASASACFRANVKLQQLLKEMDQLDENKTAQQVDDLRYAIETLESQVDLQELSTLTNLQAYTIVKERLLEAMQFLDDARNSSDRLAYATERLYSAASWSAFFNKDKHQLYVINEDVIQRSCVDKLSEVQESIQYLKLFYPSFTGDIEAEYEDARQYYTNAEYELCLAKASQVKGRTNVFVSLRGLTDDDFGNVLDNKIAASKRAIIRQIENGAFPIQAYSYYEYANALREDDPYSAMLYTEYALELSNLDIYFKEKKAPTRQFNLNLDSTVWMFLWGILLGYILCYVTKKPDTRKSGKSRKFIKLRD